jgi:hypothetical protein
MRVPDQTENSWNARRIGTERMSWSREALARAMARRRGRARNAREALGTLALHGESHNRPGVETDAGEAAFARHVSFA